MIVPLFVGREKSIGALEEVMRSRPYPPRRRRRSRTRTIPAPTISSGSAPSASVLQLLPARRHCRVFVEGNARREINSYSDNPRFFQARASLLPEVDADPRRAGGARRGRWSAVRGVRELNRSVPPEVLVSPQPDRRSRRARRHRSRRTCRSRSRQAAAAGDQLARRSARASATLLESEISVLAGGEAHPLPVSARVGPDAAGVLPQRAAQGDPHGARRARRRARQLPRSRSASARPSCPRRRARRPSPRWRSCAA